MPETIKLLKASDTVLYLHHYSEDRTLRRQRLLAAAHDYAQRRGVDLADDTLAESERGKPFLAAAPEIHFSLSHSGSYWLAAFSDAEVGVDIQIHRRQNYHGIAKRWFHPLEQQYLASADLSATFFAIWSAKESYSKYLGRGIDANFATFSVSDGRRLLPYVNGCRLCQPLRFHNYACCLTTTGPGKIVLWQQIYMP